MEAAEGKGRPKALSLACEPWHRPAVTANKAFNRRCRAAGGEPLAGAT
jgi:hypothetical protein